MSASQWDCVHTRGPVVTTWSEINRMLALSTCHAFPLPLPLPLPLPSLPSSLPILLTRSPLTLHTLTPPPPPAPPTDHGVFGVPLHVLVQLDRQRVDHVQIPLFIHESIQFLEENGLETEGILRVPGAAVRIKVWVWQGVFESVCACVNGLTCGCVSGLKCVCVCEWVEMWMGGWVCE